MGDTTGMLCELINTRRLNSISCGICQQNIHFNMFLQHLNHCEAFARNRGEILRTCFCYFPLCFHLNLYTSIKPCILLKYLYKTQKTQFLTSVLIVSQDLQDDLSDLLDQANEDQETLGRQYGTPELDEGDIEAGIRELLISYSSPT